jgi:hypothetical protein
LNVFWAGEVSDDWEAVRDELERIFALSRTAARAEESFVFVVCNDDLLGRRGAGNAMVACGLLSAARTAALEGVRQGWTVNVGADAEGADHDGVESWARRLLDSGEVTGELVRIGAGHLGKALP